MNAVLERTVKESPMKLDVGCGPTCREGYVGVDIHPYPCVTYVCEAWNTGLKALTVDAIYSRHMLEHLTFADGARSLAHWYGVLTAGGRVEVIVPDLHYHAQQLLVNPDAPSLYRADVTNYRHAIGSIFGWQRCPHDVHQSGYTEDVLRAALCTAGFTAIERLPTDPWHLFLSARKAPS